MRLYKITNGVPGDTEYHGTRGDGHSALRDMESPPDADGDTRKMELVEVPTDKESLIQFLNGIEDAEKTHTTWVLTPRGGIKEEVTE